MDIVVRSSDHACGWPPRQYSSAFGFGHFATCCGHDCRRSVDVYNRPRLGHNAVGAPDPVAFLAVPLGEMVIFPILVAFGVYYRQRKEAHKRLMLLATLSLLTAPLGRLPIVGGSPPAVALVYAALVLAGPIYDRIAYGRFNRVYLAGAMALWVSMPVRFAIGATQVWHDFAAWLIS